MSSHYTHAKSESVCVDLARDVHGSNLVNAATLSHVGASAHGRLYTTEFHQGFNSAGDEDLYPNDREVACVVCSPVVDPNAVTPTVPGYYPAAITLHQISNPAINMAYGRPVTAHAGVDTPAKSTDGALDGAYAQSAQPVTDPWLEVELEVELFVHTIRVSTGEDGLGLGLGSGLGLG